MTTEFDLTPLLGEESQPIEFPAGLIGLEEWHRFVLIKHPAGEALRLLQSLEDDRFSLIVVDPKQIDSEYELVLSEADLELLQLSNKPEKTESDETDAGVYCILSVEEDPFNVTANLLGPLVINWRASLGRQVILSESNYTPRHPVTSSFPEPSAQEKEEPE
jgi:flagellar assembly factor FliW